MMDIFMGILLGLPGIIALAFIGMRYGIMAAIGIFALLVGGFSVLN